MLNKDTSKFDMSNFISGNKIIIFFILLFILFIYYIITESDRKSQNCKRINKNNTDNEISTFDKNDKYFNSNIKINNRNINYDYKLKDFYFKTAYNCFCSGHFKNDYIDACAFENCVDNNVLAYDMQIFSLNGQPIIASNTLNTNYYKESYDYISFNNGINRFKDNLNELEGNPLFLNLRIHYGTNSDDSYNENKKKFYDKIYDILINNLDFESTNYNFNMKKDENKNINDENRNIIIPNIPMKDCGNTIFLFVTLNDEVNLTNIKDSDLNKIVDLYGNDNGIRNYRENEIKYDGAYNPIENISKRYLSICMPKNQTKNDNYDPQHAIKIGNQFIAMNFQNKDTNLDYYNIFFNDTDNSDKNRPYKKKIDSMISVSLF